MDTTIIRTRTASHSIDEFGIFHSIYNPGVEETLADAEENIRALATFAQKTGKRYPLLVDLRRIKSQTREVRSYYAGPEALKVRMATALLVESRISTLIGNFFLTVNGGTVPTKIFTSEAQAMVWLKGFVS